MCITNCIHVALQSELLDEYTADPAAIEQLFTSLSFLFKFLQKQLVQNLPSFVPQFHRLLSHRKDYIRYDLAL